MGQGGAMLAVFIVFLSIIFVAGSYMYYSSLPPEERTVFCKDNQSEFSISFVINDNKKSILMSGERVNQKHVKIFNESAFEIRWQSKNGTQTQMFMDRIAGNLDVETRSGPRDDWDKIKLVCNRQVARF